MVRVIALLSAVFLCALLVPLPDSPSTPSTWAEGAPETWASAKTDLAALQNPGSGYVCPMDRDVSSKTPGFCPRCGMKLVTGIPDSKEYPVEITSLPRVMEPGKRIQLTFRIEDPVTHAAVRDFEIVHEKLYHFFVVSQDLSFFQHIHPEMQSNATFRLDVRLPKPGMYRVLSDFYPKGGTPQLSTSTLLVSGGGLDAAPGNLSPDLGPQHAENITVELLNDPAQPMAGRKTKMLFRVKPNDGVELYLGAWAHMLAASSDLIDMIHSHPIRVTDQAGYKQLEFERAFPRSGVYRVWVQIQRKGVVNTVAFNVPVGDPAGD